MSLDNNLSFSDIKEVELGYFDYGIYQNYPNPANHSTIIKYQLPQDGNVSLVLYNNVGAKIKDLISEQKASGIYQVEVNTPSLPVGNYYYTYKVNGFTMTKNLTIVK